MKRQTSTLLTLALGSLVAGGAAAADSPFAVNKLESGYQLAQAATDKKAEGKCGGDKKKEAKCGADKKKEAKCGADKAKEAKCGAEKKPAEKS